MKSPNAASIEAMIISYLEEVVEDMGLVSAVSPHTHLGGELGLSSVDTMNLLAAIDVHLGRRIRYEGLLMPKGEYVQELTPREITAYVIEHYDEELSSEPRAM